MYTLVSHTYCYRMPVSLAARAPADRLLKLKRAVQILIHKMTPSYTDKSNAFYTSRCRDIKFRVRG